MKKSSHSKSAKKVIRFRAIAQALGIANTTKKKKSKRNNLCEKQENIKQVMTEKQVMHKAGNDRNIVKVT